MASKGLLHRLSDEYERKSGKQGLLYISHPTKSTTRYVFTDRVVPTLTQAIQHIEKKLEELR